VRSNNVNPVEQGVLRLAHAPMQSKLPIEAIAEVMTEVVAVQKLLLGAINLYITRTPA